jgi:tetratricopeptide (TPR) repeat protein
LYLQQAFYEVVTHSDIATHDRLVREALQINPSYQPALMQLAESRWEYSGEFADAARIIERSIALDPASEDSRMLAVHIYLDLGEPDTAIAVRGEDQKREPPLDILQFQRNPRRAAELARELPAQALWFGGAFAVASEVIRDGAVVAGDYGDALARLESAYATLPPGRPRMWSRYQAMVFAHALVLAGQTDRGRKLATSTLVMLDSQSVGRVEDWLARERAAGYMVLGEKDRALDELAAAVRTKRLYRWWYTFQLDPLYEPLHRDPRFIALKEAAKKHSEEQRALLQQMRSRGEVPSRRS